MFPDFKWSNFKSPLYSILLYQNIHMIKCSNLVNFYYGQQSLKMAQTNLTKPVCKWNVLRHDYQNDLLYDMITKMICFMSWLADMSHLQDRCPWPDYVLDQSSIWILHLCSNFIPGLWYFYVFLLPVLVLSFNWHSFSKQSFCFCYPFRLYSGDLKSGLVWI